MKRAKQVFVKGRTGLTVGLAASAATITLAVLLVAPGTADATVAAVPLGTTGSFAVLAATGITNTGTTTINGNIGSYPTGSETGFASLVLNGTNYAADATSQVAQNDLVTAYNAAAAEGPTISITGGILGVETLTPGVYNSGSTIQLNGPLTLDGNNNLNSVFVFQAGSGLTTASTSQVILENGAQACNVFWQVGSSATLGSGSSFQGTILASASVTLGSSAKVSGRLLAHTGDVTLISNTVTVPTCTATTVTTPASTTTTSTTSATTTTTGVGTTAGTTTTTSPAAAPAVITVPPTHTGKPWAGWQWWIGTGILGIGGIALMVPWKMKRSLRRQR